MKHGENKIRFPVRHCNSCNHSWENIYGKLVIHLDFPSYGLQRKTCSKCIKRERDMEYFSYAQV